MTLFSSDHTLYDGEKLLWAIHKRRRNILGVGGRVPQISMLQDIRRQGLDKSGFKFRHGGGGTKNGPKNSDGFYGRPLTVV